MSHTIYNAGPQTHIRIVAAALIAATAIVTAGLSARTHAIGTQGHDAQPLLVLKAEPVQLSRYGAVIR